MLREGFIKGYISGCIIGLLIMIVAQLANMAVVGSFIGVFATVFVMALMNIAKESDYILITREEWDEIMEELNKRGH